MQDRRCVRQCERESQSPELRRLDFLEKLWVAGLAVHILTMFGSLFLDLIWPGTGVLAFLLLAVLLYPHRRLFSRWSRARYEELYWREHKG